MTTYLQCLMCVRMLDLNIRPVYECRYDERLNTKVEESTRLTHTPRAEEVEESTGIFELFIYLEFVYY